MLAIAGYDREDFKNDMYEPTDFFVMGVGRYKLINRKDFYTRREHGTKTYQLLYVASGIAEFEIAGGIHSVSKGSFVLYHPDEYQYYSYKKIHHPDIYWVHFCCAEENELSREFGLSDMHILSTDGNERYAGFFDRMIRELQWKEPFYRQKAQLLIQELLVTVFRSSRMQKEQQETNRYPYIREAIQLFHEKYDTDLSIQNYTKERGLNYYHFIDSFSKYTGMSPKQYLIQIRMDRARDLLDSPELSISEIAAMVGYENPLYFSRLFRKKYGEAPSAYRKL